MSSDDIPTLASLVGRWRGQNHLWLSPDEPVRTSDTTLDVTLAAQGQFALFAYTWAFEGAPQDGLILINIASKPQDVHAVWTDSWHMQNGIMACQGPADDQGGVSVVGAYAAPPGPDWGWRITLTPQAADRLQLIMHNITPAGQSFLAVQADYTRQA